MKLWWLRLYTFPGLKKVTWPLAAWLAANLICVTLLPTIREMTFLVAVYPWYVFINDNEYTLGNNLNFHRVHVTYRELRKALFLDVVIQVFSFVTIFLLCGLLPWIGVKDQGQVFDIIGTPTTATLFFITFLFFVASPKLGIVKQKQAEAASKMKQRLIQKRMNSAFVFVLLLLGGYLVKGRGLSLLLVSYIGASSAFMSILAEWYFDNFHISPRWRRPCELGVPVVFLVLFSLLALGLSGRAREEITDVGHNPVRRLITFEMFRDFDMLLDQDTASDLLTMAYSPGSYQDIFKYSAPEVFEVDVDQLIKTPDYRAYYHYLNTGKVPPHNLEALLRKTVNDKESWRNTTYYQKYRDSLVKYYPPASSLPSRNIASKKDGP